MNKPDEIDYEPKPKLKWFKNKRNITILAVSIIIILIIVFLSTFLPLFLRKQESSVSLSVSSVTSTLTSLITLAVSSSSVVSTTSLVALTPTTSASSVALTPAVSSSTPASSVALTTSSTPASAPAGSCSGNANSWVCGGFIKLNSQDIYWCQADSTVGVYAQCVDSNCIQGVSDYCESGIGAINAIVANPSGISCGKAIGVASQPEHLFLGNHYSQLMDLGLCTAGCCVQPTGINDKCC
jgi:hypothetical protein